MKLIKRLLICLISIMMILGAVSIIYADGRYNADRNYHYTRYNQAPQPITAGSTITILQYKDKLSSSGTGKYINTLSEPHIYCVEHGTRIKSWTNYNVSQEYTVEDPILAYILNHGPAMGSLEESYMTESSQQALWHYLYVYQDDSSKTDRIRMVGDIKQKIDKHDDGGRYACCGIENANELYNNAVTYARNINSTPSLTLEKDGNNITIKINGNFKKFNIIINDNFYAQATKGIYDEYSHTIDASSYNTEFLNVKIEALQTKYSATYNVLTNAENTSQRMIAVKSISEKEEITSSITERIEIEKLNISLQKYIVEVNDEALTTKNTSLTNRINAKSQISNEKNGKVSKNNTVNTNNKQDNAVNIEAGDYVTYKITVYNNSNITAKTIEVTDSLPKEVKYYYTSEDNTNNFGNQRTDLSLTYTIKNLVAGSEKSFYVKAYFGEYSKEIIKNEAKISRSTPNNKTDYRTIDADYVKMKDYSVSLEKFITEVSGKEISNNTSIDMSKYKDVIDYLRNKEVSIDTLIENWEKGINIDYKYDLNKDNKIDNNDYEIYNKYKTINITELNITDYLKADLNGDGHVDNIDLNIYKVIKANLNKDETLNNLDRYMFILRYMYEKGMNEENALRYLYTQRLMLETKKSREQLSNDVINHLKSDVTGDGYVNYEDYYIIQDDNVIINGESYSLNDITQQIRDLQELQTEELYDVIIKYDLNNDNKIDNTEITFFTDYLDENGKYNKIKSMNLVDIIRIYNNFIKDTDIEYNEDDADKFIYDYSGDDVLDFEDYIAIKEFYEKDNTYEDDFTGIKETLTIINEDDRYNSEYDFNDDNIINYEDYEIMKLYINFIKYCHNYIQNQDRIADLKDGLLNEITIEEINNNKYDSAFDINEDGKIDFEDYIQAQDIQREDILNEISGLLTIKENNGRYDSTFDFNEDKQIDYLDYEFLTEYYIENINDINIDDIVYNIENIIKEYSIFDRDENNKDFSKEDINTIKLFKGWKLFSESYYSKNLVLYDINQDGFVNGTDKTFIETTYEQLNGLDNLLTANNIDEIIKIFIEKYSDIKNLTVDDVVSQYTDLDSIINNALDVKEILSNETYEVKASNITYSYIEDQSRMAISVLDFYNDGLINESDIDELNKWTTIVNELGEFDKTIVITNNDINGDGKVNNDDQLFYDALVEISHNTNIKDAIKNGNTSSNTQTTGNVTGRDNKRYNESLANNNDGNKNPWKGNNKVAVEVGDKVTFTIRLRNTGDNPVKISQIYDVFTFIEQGNNNGQKLVYDSSYGIKGNGGGTIVDYHYWEEGNSDKDLDRYLIKFNNPVLLQNKNDYVDVTIKFKVKVPSEIANTSKEFYNKAGIVETKNKNNIKVNDSDGEANNYDMDFIKTKKYAVSLEKFIYSVNGSADGITGREGNPIYNDADTKHNNIVTVGKDDYVTYQIIVKNDGTKDGDNNPFNDEYADIKSLTILDTILGTDNKGSGFAGYYYEKYDANAKLITNTKTYEHKIDILNRGISKSIWITLKVSENNISLKELINQAEIKDNNIINKNDETIKDSTPNNNLDQDYINMKDIIISGTVWNDLALDKTNSNYNGLYDSSDEKGISGITVKLYRVNDSKVIKTATTNDDGEYSFSLNYIKGPKTQGTNRWNGTYYSYYVVFEYDGITYTSTPDGTTFKSVNNTQYRVDSNAREKLNNEEFVGVVSKSRKQFNDSFSTINNSKGIAYTTRNEDGYIPQSNHIYNSSMNMQSSTSLINIGDYTEDQLKYIGLGLRGRDIFDLELTTDVSQILMIVNNEPGVYENTNIAEFRRSDYLEDKVAKEDMKTTVSEKANTYLNNQEQKVRESDYNVNVNAGYDKTQGIQGIEVIYKITVKNTSVTKGTATKITSYYDSNYTFFGAYPTLKDAIGYSNALTLDNNLSKDPGTNDKYGYKTINTPANMLEQNGEMEIYVVYFLNNPADNLKNINKDNPFVTLNMAEITEYKTMAKNAANEATRGLIDKDSAPGSANREQVRTTDTIGQNTDTINGNPTTVEYYFNRNNLNKLKYEDDTYATPTIFVAAMDDNGTPDNPNDDTYNKRAIVGTVFEDYTRIIGGEDEDIRVKTGDGVQDTTYNIEPGVEGITVKLYEGVVSDSTLRFTTTTNTNGEYVFEGYLPGHYIVKYEYGDTNNTFLLNNDPNTKSYNGEDFQSTNNTGSFESNKLDSHELTWYVYNESKGISTATDVVGTRQNVSTNVTNFTDSQMTVLNNARDGMSERDAKVGDITVESIRNATQMEALTNTMRLTMEKSILDGDEIKQDKSFGKYVVENMNFGIAEVPVTTIDMQKHVHSFKITDSTGTNPLAGAEIDTDNTSVVVNASKIAVNRLDTVIKVLANNLGMTEAKVRDIINYNQNKSQDINITIAQEVDETSKTNLKNDMTKYSLAREIKILYGWKVTAGAVKAEPGISTIFVEIEDDKLQGAKLEVVYEVSANIYAEKNFNNEAVTVPTIEGMVDYIDNDLSYDENKNTVQGNNSQYWSVTTYDAVQGLFEGQGDGLDPEGRKYSTIVSAKEDSDILQEKCGEGKVYITLEKVLSSTDSTLADVILNSVDSYEYTNTVEITKLNYENQTGSGSSGGSSGTGGSGGTSNPDGENDFVFKDRVRTPDRFIIVPGMSHDYQAAETISISPPTGDSSISTVYYVIAAIALTVLAAGIFGIKKFVIKK